MKQNPFIHRLIAMIPLTLLATIFIIFFTRNVAQTTAVANTTTHKNFLPLLLTSVEPLVFLETFDGNPAAPQAWNPSNWDLTIHSRDRETWESLPHMHAEHGHNCDAPPASHLISAYEEAVFICRNHLMTAVDAKGYGMIYLTPDHMVDFSAGEAIIRFDVSTARTSGRDWIDLWITPYEDNLQLALDSWLPDLSGEPRNAIHIAMDFSLLSKFRGEVVRDFQVQPLPGTPPSWQGYETFLTPSATRRDTFELRISNSHIKFGMPDYNFWWIDTAIAPLGWSQGIVQFGHHTYNPTKDCPLCTPNTWHWDNMTITPAVPFTILRANRRHVDATTTPVVHFPTPAPTNAHLRFAGIGKNLEVSFNNGVTWQPAQIRKQANEDHFGSYWTPVPAGIGSVHIRGTNWWGGGWHVRDISIWAGN